MRTFSLCKRGSSRMTWSSDKKMAKLPRTGVSYFTGSADLEKRILSEFSFRGCFSGLACIRHVAKKASARTKRSLLVFPFILFFFFFCRRALAEHLSSAQTFLRFGRCFRPKEAL